MMNDMNPLRLKKGLLHDQDALKHSDIGGTPTGMNSRDSEECVCVFVLCNGESCCP